MRLVRTVPAAAMLLLSACSVGEPVSQAPANTAASPSVEVVSASGVASSAPVAGARGEPFSLLVHCGVSTTEYAGRNWAAVPGPAPKLPPRADAAGISVNANYIDGVMTKIGEDRLRFLALDTDTGKVGASIEFVPAVPPVSHCE
jgi:hypothetical protein